MLSLNVVNRQGESVACPKGTGSARYESCEDHYHRQQANRQRNLDEIGKKMLPFLDNHERD